MSNERVVCAACGSNNFATQAACWKCGKPLSAGTAAPPSPISAAAVPAAAVQARPAPVPASYDLRNETPAAFWSSVAMGIVFPMFAIPIGMVFLMLDDRRKAQIGWWNILFGLLGTLLNGILVAVSLAPLLMNVSRMIPGIGGIGGRAGQAQSQDMNAEAPPLDLPGQRPFASPPR